MSEIGSANASGAQALAEEKKINTFFVVVSTDLYKKEKKTMRKHFFSQNGESAKKKSQKSFISCISAPSTLFPL